MASPPLTFRLLDLAPEIFRLVLNAVDKPTLAAARSVSSHSKEIVDCHFYATFFTEIESSLTQHKLENLLWLSQQPHLAYHVKSLSFAIDDNYSSHFNHSLITESMGNFSKYGNITTLGVIPNSWHHTLVSEHCNALTQFAIDHLLPYRDTIKPRSWKIVVKIDSLRFDRDTNLEDCFGCLAHFVFSELLRNTATPQGVDLEIHERAGDPIRYVEVTKNSTFQAHVTPKNFNCEDADRYANPHTLDDAGFTSDWHPETLAIKDFIFLHETLTRSMCIHPSPKHLIIEIVRMREFVGDDYDIEPADWIETLQHCDLNGLESCRFVNLRDGNGDFFVEGIWESTATPGRSVSDAVAGLIANVQASRSLESESGVSGLQ